MVGQRSKMRMKSTYPKVVVAVAAVVSLLAGCGGTGYTPPSSDAGSVTLLGAVDKLPPKTVDPDDLRWRDLAGELYTSRFRSTFSYTDTSTSFVRVTWDDGLTTLSGTLKAVKLKPNFAYQIKLIGMSHVTDANDPGSPDSDPEGWASWQIGHHGRWWCIEDAWNVADGSVQWHIDQGHHVVGYLLVDLFITDRRGNATRPFLLDSSYHVLWRTDQRGRQANDSPIEWRDLWRGAWGYGLFPIQPGGRFGVYAEWEPGRATPGTLELPDGTYPVLLNLTEESFHDNLGNRVEYGGFWAQVLEGEVDFIIGAGRLGPGRIIGSVRDANHRPVPNAVVKLRKKSTGYLKIRRTRDNGRYGFPKVSPGRGYVVSCTYQGRRAVKRHVRVVAGQTAPVYLRLP